MNEKRDRFAAAALKGLAVNPDIEYGVAADQAYEFADQMMRRREQPCKEFVSAYGDPEFPKCRHCGMKEDVHPTGANG